MTMNVSMRTEAAFTCVKTITVATPVAVIKASTWRLMVTTA